MPRIPMHVLKAMDTCGQIRCAPSPTDGPQSISRYHLFRYGGGDRLSLVTTDNRIMLASTFSVTPGEPPWHGAIESWRWHAVVQHLGMGGGMDFRPINNAICELTRGNLRLRFPRRDLANMFAIPATPVDAPQATLDRDALLKPLLFLATSSRTESPQYTKHTCVLGSDGTAASTDGALFAVTSGPQLPFPMSLRCRDVKPLVRWLGFVATQLGEGNFPITITHISVDRFAGKYRISAGGDEHVIYVPEANPGPLRQIVGADRQSHIVCSGQVQREALVNTAKLFGGKRIQRRIVCQFQPLIDVVGRLHIWQKQPNGRPSDSELILAEFSKADPAIDLPAFEVAVRPLVKALERFSTTHVELTYRARFHRLGIRINANHPAEVFLRVNPARVPYDTPPH